VVNDVNGELTGFWRVLQDPAHFEVFKRRVEAMPFSEKEWQDSSRVNTENAVEQAVAFFVRCRQSLAARMDTFAPLSRTRTRRKMNEQASAWLTAVDGLAEVHARLQRVAILNRDGLEVIKSQDGKDTLFHCDPPYLHETRVSRNVYAFEMTRDQHEELLDVLFQVEGKVMLSGYASELYDAKLQTWTRHTFDMANHAAGGQSKARETEVLWCNF
jgi:DNA adenine methylase